MPTLKHCWEVPGEQSNPCCSQTLPDRVTVSDLSESVPTHLHPEKLLPSGDIISDRFTIRIAGKKAVGVTSTQKAAAVLVDHGNVWMISATGPHGSSMPTSGSSGGERISSPEHSLCHGLRHDPSNGATAGLLSREQKNWFTCSSQEQPKLVMFAYFR